MSFLPMLLRCTFLSFVFNSFWLPKHGFLLNLTFPFKWSPAKWNIIFSDWMNDILQHAEQDVEEHANGDVPQLNCCVVCGMPSYLDHEYKRWPRVTYNKSHCTRLTISHDEDWLGEDDRWWWWWVTLVPVRWSCCCCLRLFLFSGEIQLGQHHWWCRLRQMNLTLIAADLSLTPCCPLDLNRTR